MLFDIGIATVITRFENVEKGGGNAGKFENLNDFFCRNNGYFGVV